MRWLLLPLVLTGCGASDDTTAKTKPGDAGSDAVEAGSDSASSCSVALPEVSTFVLTHAAFPGSGHPDVAVGVPAGFDPCDHPSLVVFFHGFQNCVTNAISSVDSECTPGAGVRTALHLAEQLQSSKANAILVVPEIAFDVASGDPGNLANPGELEAMLNEILVDELGPLLPVPLDVGSFDRVVLASHSGGYQAVLALLGLGEVDVDQIQLFDSLYAGVATFADFIDENPGAFESARRFANVYTTPGGTYDLSESLAAEVELAFSEAGLAPLVFHQSGEPTAADLAHPVFFNHTELSHVEVPRHYFEPLLVASGIRILP